MRRVAAEAHRRFRFSDTVPVVPDKDSDRRKAQPGPQTGSSPGLRRAVTETDTVTDQ